MKEIIFVLLGNLLTAIVTAWGVSASAYERGRAAGMGLGWKIGYAAAKKEDEPNG